MIDSSETKLATQEKTMMLEKSTPSADCCFPRTLFFHAAMYLFLLPLDLCSQTLPESKKPEVPEIVWVEIEGGTFTMGNGSSARQVTLSTFMMSATEITFDQYDAFCVVTGKQKPDDNGWGRGKRPVINVSWNDIQQYCRWLSRETGSEVRLPNEAEWEYAARGGHRSGGHTYSGSNKSDEVAWNEGNSGGKTQPVGAKKPNELGLYDMSGNVWEWCLDWNPDDSNKHAQDSAAPARGIRRAGRGGSFDNPSSSNDLRFSIRAEVDSGHSNAGFRIVKTK
jgi:sulfatase modifying factor 1